MRTDFIRWLKVDRISLWQVCRQPADVARVAARRPIRSFNIITIIITTSITLVRCAEADRIWRAGPRPCQFLLPTVIPAMLEIQVR